MQEKLAWADGLFAVGGRVTTTSFLLSLETVAIGHWDVTSFVLQANSVREESCAGVSFKKSPAVLHSGRAGGVCSLFLRWKLHRPDLCTALDAS